MAMDMMTGIHSVFAPADDPAEDSILVKKLERGEGVWALKKDLLGFEFDGAPGRHTIWLEEEKRDKLLAALKSWLRGSKRNSLGVPFADFESTVAKV